ncbi:MAG: hypothetical protein AAGU21_13745 [Solidesulfovibrio sp.]|uniref:hypothetical protein n=1 Tax=Solidesulfovibrio sp. TaxID=2910990 RepID=UPI002B20CE05|nr:hypothetical protein [Solidesulfovibrio sp.]MEA4857750.1 hypothetical protein [Solidesulfovibrio sp.]
MAKKKKASRPDRGHEAKKKSRSTFPAVILVAGLWRNTFMGNDLARTVPLALQASTLSMVGRPCLLCGQPARFAGIMEFPVPALPIGPATAVVGMCSACTPPGMREGRVDPLEASPEFAQKVRDAIVLLLIPSASEKAV